MSLTRETIFDRRSCVRIKVDLQVQVSVDDEDSFTFAADISEGGMFIHELLPFEVGTTIEISFKLPGDDEPLECEAEVVQARREFREGIPDSAIGNGLKFVDMAEEDRTRLVDFLQERMITYT